MRDHDTPLCAEFAFLLAATRWPHDSAAIERIRTAGRFIEDPARLLALTRRHHVAGLVARAVAHCDSLSGTMLRRELAFEARELACEQMTQLLQTRAAVHALRVSGVPVLVLKGAPAALSLYGEAGVRTSIDIDLLIARPDLDRAQDALSSAGYVRSEPPLNADARQLAAVARHGKDWAFDYAHGDTGIELHWRLFQNPGLLGDVSVAQAVEREVAPGLVLPVLPEMIGALYLVAHGAEHAWSRLKWLADLAGMLHRDPGAADRLLAQARQYGIVPLTAAALLLAHELYAAPIGKAADAWSTPDWRTRSLLKIARASLVGAQDGAELEDSPMATTCKNLGHYLFRAHPRYWWRELTYDLFHDVGGDHARSLSRRLGSRIANVARLSSIRAAG